MTPIEQFINDYRDGDVEVTPDVHYSLYDTMNSVQAAIASQFRNAGNDEDATSRLYVNAAWILSRSAFYASDIDTKDINIRGMSPDGVKLSTLLRPAIQTHLRLVHFGKTIERIRWKLITEGHVITKIVDGDVHLVDLRNIIRPPHIRNIQDTDFIERHFVAYEDLELQKDTIEKWDQIETMYDAGITRFTVYDYWHRKGKEKWCTRYVDCSEYEPDRSNEPSTWDPHIEIVKFRTPTKKRIVSERQKKTYKSDRMDAYPFVETPFMELPGRWMGVGFFELVIQLMEKINAKWEMSFEKERADIGTFIYKRNAANGESLKQSAIDRLRPNAFIEIASDEDLQRMSFDNKVGELISIHDKLFAIAQQMCGISGAGLGEVMPASTAATTASIIQQNQKTTYDYIVETMHHFLVELFQDFYIDIIIDELTAKEYTAIIGDKSALRELDEMFIDEAVTKASKAALVKPTELEIDEQKNTMRKEMEGMGDSRFVKIKREIVDKILYVVEFFVKNETFDKAAKIQNLLYLIQDQQFPGDKLRLYETFLDLIGEDPRSYKIYEGQQQQITAGAGQISGATPTQGGLPIPAMAG